MTPLFRPEALQARQQAWLGGVQLIRPLSLTVLTVCAAAAAAIVVAFLFVGEYTRKARVPGVLVPDLGLIRLIPQEAGTVIERHAREGQKVKQDDVLFVLSLDRVTVAGDAQVEVRRHLDAQRRSLDEALRREQALLVNQQAATTRELADRRNELAQIDAEVRLQRQRLALAQQAQARLEALRADHFISSAQVQAKSEEVLAVQAQLAGLERERVVQQREIGTLEAQARELPLRAQTAAGALQRQLASVAQEAAESEAKRRIIVRAPSDGVLGAVLAEPGQMVSPAVALATFLPKGAVLQAHLYAPSSALGFVHPDQPVQLRYQAYPYQKFGQQTGRVLHVAHTPLQAGDLANVPLAGVSSTASTVNGEPLYRITVALARQDVLAYGQAQPLAAGMQLEADVQLDRRRLVEWLFEPLLGWGDRVAGGRS